jgi:hypothetical protein
MREENRAAAPDRRMPDHDPDPPMATYRERLLQVRRTLDLHADRVIVRAHWLMGGSFEQTIRLDNLSPQPNLILVRQRLFKKSLAVASIAAAAAVVFDRYGTNIAQRAVYASVALALAAGAVTVLSYPKVMFARFMTKAGKAGPDVARAGPDRAGFQAFIEQMQRQIRRR